jgi:hypothetical protein
MRIVIVSLGKFIKVAKLVQEVTLFKRLHQSATAADLKHRLSYFLIGTINVDCN